MSDFYERLMHKARKGDVDLEKLSRTIRKEIKGTFKPCAYHLKEMDMLIFATKDVSYRLRETFRKGERLSWGGVLYDTHTDDLVGFELYGITRVMKENGLEKINNKYKISELTSAAASLRKEGNKSLFGEHTEEVLALLKKHDPLVRF